jgi:hypothetical protein
MWGAPPPTPPAGWGRWAAFTLVSAALFGIGSVGRCGAAPLSRSALWTAARRARADLPVYFCVCILDQVARGVAFSCGPRSSDVLRSTLAGEAARQIRQWRRSKDWHRHRCLPGST